AVEAQLEVGRQLLGAAPKIGVHHVQAVVEALPAVGALPPALKVGFGNGKNGRGQHVPPLLHREDHEELARACAAGLHQHGMKELQVVEAAAVGFEAGAQVGH
nr:hypothetical protein [Tanacetum cinerariifolium]